MAMFRPFSALVVRAPMPGIDLEASHAAPAAPPVASFTLPANDLTDFAVSPIFLRAPLPVVPMNRPASVAALRNLPNAILQIKERLIGRFSVTHDLILQEQ